MNMPEIRNILSPVATPLSLGRMIRLTGKTLIFPFYHMVSDDPPPHIRHLYRVKSLAEFRSDLDGMLKYFEPASPEWLINPEKMKPGGKPAFILSFDDGLHEVSEFIAPVLEEKGLNAVFFLNNDFIGNQGLFFRYRVSLLIDRLSLGGLSDRTLKEASRLMGLEKTGRTGLIRAMLDLGYASREMIGRLEEIMDVDTRGYLDSHHPYLDEPEIRNLLDRGFYIGGHSHDHPSFRDLDADAQFDTIISSVEDIRRRFGIPYSLFSFPFSDIGVGKKVFGKLYPEGRTLLDASFGTSGLKADEAYPHFQRIPLEKSGIDAENYLKTEYFYYILKSMTGRNRISRPA